MEHWFDDLVKAMARGTLSRRGALKGTLQAGLAAAAGVFGRADGLARIGPGEPGTPQPQVRVEKRGPCTVTFNGEQSTVKHSVQSALNERLLTHNLEVTLTRPAHRGQSPQINSVRRIRLGQNLLLRVERESREGSTEVKVTYGPAFEGIRLATFTTDGKVIEGLIDGRRTVPLAIGADPSSLKFADGNTPPQVFLRPAVERALTAILKQAKDEISSCGQAGPPSASNAGNGWPLLASNQVPPSPWASRFAGKGAASSLLALTLRRSRSGSRSLWGSPELADSAGEPLAMPGIVPGPDPAPPQGNPVLSQACQSCQNSCAAAGATCDAGVSGGCVASLFFYGACVVVGLAACAVGGGVCLNNCNNPGGACCPVGCPNGGCCDTAWQCTPTESVCCAPNVFVCGNNCCPPGFICKEGICCTTDRTVCHGVCCPQGQVCSTEGICCRQLAFNAKPVSCGGTCCAEGQKCTQKSCCPDKDICGNDCCRPDQCKNGKCCFDSQAGPGRWCGDHCCNGPCCGDKCCELCLGGQMIKGECCPQERVCGNICCASDLSCTDARSGTCKKVTCPQGEYKCSGPLADGTYATVCCTDKNPVCCDKVCCKSGYICLTNGEGVFGCNPAPPIK